MEMLVLFLLGLATGVYGKCECQYENQTYNPNIFKALWIMSSYDDVIGQGCETNCTIHLDSGNPAWGIGNYTRYTWDSMDGAINIYNSDASGAKLTPFMLGINQSTSSRPEYSTGQYLLVEIITTGSVLSSMDVGPATTPPPTNSPTTTTPTYSGPYPINPALISHDLVVMVDTGKNFPNSGTDIKDSQIFASALVNQINSSVFASATNDQTPVTGTRLSLNQLNYLGYGPFFMPWEVTAAEVCNQINNLVVVPSQKTPYTEAIKQFTDANSPFSPVRGSLYEPSRNTAQRTLLVVSTSPPNDLPGLIGVDLTKYDIHPIFVAFNFNPQELGALNETWTVVRADKTTDVPDFVKNYFLSQNAGKNLCSQPQITTYTATTNSQQINWPPCPVSGCSSFTAPDYQKNRYCNFQQFSIRINSDPGISTCFTVKHETEADKDTLKFYQKNGYNNMVEVVSLSGIDVAGTAFQIVNDTQIDFETNESQVFGGFQIEFKTCS